MKQCRYCEHSTEGTCNRNVHWYFDGAGQICCSNWQSGGVLPEVWVDANV